MWGKAARVRGETAGAAGDASWRRKRRALGNVPRLLRLVMAAAPRHLLAALCCRLTSAVLPITSLWVAKLIVDHVVLIVTTKDTAALGELWLLFGAEIALAALGEGLARVSLCNDSLLALRVGDHINLRLVEHACTLDLATIEDPAFHDTLERARKEAGARIDILAGLGRLVQQGVAFLSYAAGVLWFSWTLLGLLTLSAVPILLGETHFAAMAYLMAWGQTAGRREIEYLKHLGVSQQSAKEVRAFGLESYLRERFVTLASQIRVAHRRLAVRRAAVGALLGTAGLASYYLAYGVVLRETLAGHLSIGTMTFLAGTFLRSRGTLQEVVSAFTTVADQTLFLTNLFDFFDVRPRAAAPSPGRRVPRPIVRGFEFRDVTFQYPGRPRPALRNVSFHIERNECLALVGQSGAGKTTLVKLLTRLYDPTEGVVLLDGVDLRDYDYEELRREVGVIFQDAVRFDMSVRQNIDLGGVADACDLSRIEAAAIRSGAAAVIARLPRGYDQMLGRRFDGGVELSGGEWQMMALARAYMRDPQLLVLDEPTASLDALAEAEVFRGFSELRRGRTTVLITHRLGTIQMADRILVLERGELREQGTHQQLLDHAGAYAELFHAQAKPYR